jgi:trk system potassium uptake protein TrkH
LAGFAVVVLPTLLFMRHWLGALEVETVANFGDALQALWGSAFTVLSFLTTTGFVSDSWVAAQTWSGLQTPGLLLVGLVLMGGGVATTAGGVKLLRVYALYKHGVREMAKLIYPHSVGGAGRLGRRIRREGPISRGSSSCCSS